MKIDIITIHCQTNFGSAFQCFALHRFLNLHHFDNQIIDYRPSYIENNFGNGIKGTIKKMLFAGSINQGKKKYDEFISKHIRLTTRTYRCYKDLEEYYEPSDILMAGSDQLWNTRYDCGRDDSYRLTFTNTSRKISYATSLNSFSMSKADMQRLAEQISCFEALSVREKSSAEALSKIMNREIKFVCDPVFLLGIEEYQQMFIDMPYDNYILVYLADARDMLDKTVEFVKKKLGCKVISVCGIRPHCRCDIHLKNPGPQEMLSLINGSRMVITGSFHATSFSHILHKNFITLLPNENAERIKNLISISGLSSQICRSEVDLQKVNFDIDFEEADIALKKLREDSKRWLLQHIEKIYMK